MSAGFVVRISVCSLGRLVSAHLPRLLTVPGQSGFGLVGTSIWTSTADSPVPVWAVLDYVWLRWFWLSLMRTVEGCLEFLGFAHLFRVAQICSDFFIVMVFYIRVPFSSLYVRHL